MSVNINTIIKIGKTVLNIGSSLYLLKTFGDYYKPDTSTKHKNEATNYYEVVSVIVGSDMLTRYKEELIEIVDKNNEANYYKAVAEIINSNMLTSNKINMIRSLSNK